MNNREGQAIKDQEKSTSMAIRRQRDLHIQKEAFVDEAISNLEGTATSDMLDFLSKELIRLQVDLIFIIYRGIWQIRGA